MNKRGALKRAPPPPVEGEDDESEEDSDSSSVAGRQPQAKSENGWHSGSDEDKGPKRTTGTGPRYSNLPPRLLALQSQGQLQLDDDDEDSEEDVPLVATLGRAVQRATRLMADDSSDEDKPLTALIDKTKRKSSLSVSLSRHGGSLPAVSVGGGSLFGGGPTSPLGGGLTSPHEADNEDDKPLGLRASRVMSTSGHDEDEDDKPLGLHPDQMRRSQYFVAAQQQAQAVQQQQMMMQAQAMHQSMMFGAPSIMSMPVYGPPMAPQMMMAPPPLPSTPPPVPDAVKLTRVDKWRHDVAGEGEP